MKVTITLIAAAALACGCKKNTADTTKPTISGSAATAPAPVPAKPLAGDELVKKVQDCWADWQAAKWADFKTCYSNDAIAELPGSGIPAANGNAAIADMENGYRAAFSDEKAALQLVLVNGKKIASVALLTGKQTSPLKMPIGELPVTNRPFGLFMGQMMMVDDTGKITHEWDFFDMQTLVGQLKPMKDHPVRPLADKLPMLEQVAIAKDDAKEHANLATFQQAIDKFNKHDVKGFGELLADDVMWSEQPMAKDYTKKDLMTHLPEMWKAFSDLKFKISDAWAAGDYVAATETFEGTNDGDVPMMHVKKTGKKVSVPFLAIHKIDGSKIKATWIFFQGGDLAKQLGLDHAEAANKLTKN